jgi:glucose-1-phosphate cytidylyltransferase
MKAVILAGGKGSRLGEETVVRPKPLVEVGGKPILWHIMKIYSAAGINDFVICLGYKGYLIKEYFANYFIDHSDVTMDIRDRSIEVHQSTAEPWRITLVDTGEESGTGGRLKQILPYVKDEDAFCMTYGDGVGAIDVQTLVNYHRLHGCLATVTATRPLPRFGVIHLVEDVVSIFEEKPHGDDDWVSGGFFVLSPKVLDLIEDNKTYWERAPMHRLVEMNQLRAFQHEGFWRPMDTLSDKVILEDLWHSGNAPWKIW